MEELDWIVVGPILAAMAAIWMVYFKREEIVSLRHKGFTTKLDSTIRFFKDFYKNTNEKKLVLDRAAQDVAKLSFVDFKTINYLITLHEHELVNLDEMLNFYRRGRKFIHYDASSQKINSENFRLKIKDNSSVRFQAFKYTTYYFISAFFCIFPLFFSSWFVQILNAAKAPFIVWILAALYFIATFMLAIRSLFDTSDLRDADTFIQKLKEADQEYKKIEQIELHENSTILNIPFTNIKIIRKKFSN
ncbi:hypothetical protein I5735_08285 [Acinetobacter baumannii]|nr:hypothetical protein [Acinetobacter baumannii]